MPAKNLSSAAEPTGNEKERELFHEVNRHYQMAKEDLEQRLSDWDTKDELFRSYVDGDAAGYPYHSVVSDPRVFTALFEKTARLFANKPRGRLVPREGGDALGAQINNELLKFQWDDAERVDATPMIAKWAQMDMSARKYGASFALCKWRYERKIEKNGKGKDKEYKSVPWFDGPSFRPLINRDCLPNPSYSTIKNWFQHRDYLTFQEMQTVNDASRSKPVYKNLDILRSKIKDEKTQAGGDRRDTNYASRNKSIKGLTDYLGSDEVFKVVEVVTEYRRDRWITIAPKYGVVLRDIENPYDHGQIPVVMLKYYPIDDDLYGLSEIEPVERLQKATNALINQYLDAVNMSLYTPLKIRATGVQMHTIEFGPGAKWIMNDPVGDVIPHDTPNTGVAEFTNTYSFMISAMQSALGETSQGISNISPFESDKTATEINDIASQRRARDNFNQIFLSEALKKQMMFWFNMNKQFLFSNPREQQKVIRIVGKEALRYFEQRGLSKLTPTQDAEEMFIKAQEEGNLDVRIQDLPQEPLYPVNVEDEVIPKLNMEEGGEMGMLIIEPEDLSGTYDYIPDVESMQIPNKTQQIRSLQAAVDLFTDPATHQLLQAEGYKLKFKELLEDYLEGIEVSKDADKYFEKGVEGGFNQTGATSPQALPAGGGAVGTPGMAGGLETMAPGQAQPGIPGPAAV